MFNTYGRKLKFTFYFIDALYNLGVVVFGATIYLYLESVGYDLNQISTFISIFWIVSILTELPSGIIADKIGRKNTMILSCVIRAIGLLGLFISSGEIIYLFIGAIFTSLGESFKSGTWDSWFVDNINKVDGGKSLDKVFSFNGVIGTTIGLLGGFFGTQLLGITNLSYPLLAGAILLVITMVVVIFFVEEGNNLKSSVKKEKNIINVYKNFYESMILGFKYFKSNNNFMILCLTFLPLTIILAGPGDYWQIFFQDGNDNLITGYLWVGIGIATILGTLIVSKIPRLEVNRINILIINIIVNTISIMILVNLESFYLAIFLFLVHVFITAGDEIIRITFLHKNIETEKRATIISFYYTLEAIFTVIGLQLIGFFGEVFSLGTAWFINALIGFIIAFPLMIFIKIKERKFANE